MFFYEEILREFQKNEVKYIIVGGVAFNLLGGMRNTFDLDLLVYMQDENLLKIIKIMKKHGYFVKQPVNPEDFADKKIRRSWIKQKHMKAFNFYKSERSFEEVDIIIDSPINFKQAIKDVRWVKVGGLNLPVISEDNLIKMKKAAKRKEDEFDIKELKKIKRLTNESC